MSNKLYTMPLFSIFIKSLGEINFNFMPSLCTKYTISVRYVENDKVPPINKKKQAPAAIKIGIVLFTPFYVYDQIYIDNLIEFYFAFYFLLLFIYTKIYGRKFTSKKKL